MNQIELIKEFINGAAEGVCSGGGNLKIRENQLIHYQTPIAERKDGLFIINTTRYSLVTGRIQKTLNEFIPPEKKTIVKGVAEGYKGTLSEFIN